MKFEISIDSKKSYDVVVVVKTPVLISKNIITKFRKPRLTEMKYEKHIV